MFRWKSKELSGGSIISPDTPGNSLAEILSYINKAKIRLKIDSKCLK